MYVLDESYHRTTTYRRNRFPRRDDSNLLLHIVSAFAFFFFLSILGGLLPLDLLQNAVQEGLDGIAGRHGRGTVGGVEGKVGQNGIELVSRGQGCR